ncbi:MAG: rod shape-determining protein MreD [Bacteroidia bacterium]
MIVNILRYMGLFALIILIQLFILNNVFIGNYYAFLFQPQLIVMFLLLLPASMTHNWLILVSFMAGFLFDVFFQTYGVHAAAATFVGFFRYYATRDVENVIAARDDENQIWTSKKGNSCKWAYFLTFISIYHFLFLLIDTQGHNFFTIFIPAFISSSIITFILILILENLIYKPSRN